MSATLHNRDRAVEKLTASTLINIGGNGEPVLRTLALDYAAEVDRQHGEGNEFGRTVLRHTLRRALNGYFVRSGVVIPGEDAVRSDSDSFKVYSADKLKVLGSVMGAFGMAEGEGVTITKLWEMEDASLPQSELAIATFDYTVPGAEYLKIASEVINWDSRHTLFV